MYLRKQLAIQEFKYSPEPAHKTMKLHDFAKASKFSSSVVR